MSRTITVKNFNFSTRKSYGSEFAATAPWGRQTSLALGIPGLRPWQGILMNYIKKHSCFLCLKEHYGNSVVYFTRLSIWGWKGACIVAAGVYIFRASTGNGASVLLRININSCRIINWKQSALLLRLVLENPGWVDWMCCLSSVATKFGSRIFNDALKIK